MNYNKKINGLVLAKQQFVKDLQKDIDFISYKQRAYNEKELRNYGTVNAVENRFELNKVGLASESLISQYKKEISCH